MNKLQAALIAAAFATTGAFAADAPKKEEAKPAAMAASGAKKAEAKAEDKGPMKAASAAMKSAPPASAAKK